jgi:hypothetical protein
MAHISKKARFPFKQVDVYRPSFGLISEKAVYDVFQSTFKIPKHEMRKYSFQKCVKALRELDPERHEEYKKSITNKR